MDLPKHLCGLVAESISKHQLEFAVFCQWDWKTKQKHGVVRAVQLQPDEVQFYYFLQHAQIKDVFTFDDFLHELGQKRVLSAEQEQLSVQLNFDELLKQTLSPETTKHKIKVDDLDDFVGRMDKCELQNYLSGLLA